MLRFQKIIDNAIKEAMSDVYLTGKHPMVSRKNGMIKFHTDQYVSAAEIL